MPNMSLLDNIIIEHFTRLARQIAIAGFSACGLFSINQEVYGQSNHPAIIFPEFSYQMGIPAGDFSNRFGNHLGLSGGINYQIGNSPINLALRYSLYFGNQVKEDVLFPFRTSYEGLLIGFDQFLTELKLRERAFMVHASAGSLIPLDHNHSYRKSIRYQMGVGFFEHRIRFVDDASALPQFTSSLIQGLDRLSNGLALIPSIGYESLSDLGKFSWYAGVESIFGFTKDRRSYSYDLGQPASSKTRLDILLQFKLSIYLPFSLSNVAEEIEY